MKSEPHLDDSLEFACVLAELHGLVGESVVAEVSAMGRSAVCEARGRLEYLADLQLTFGSSASAPAVIAFALEGAGFSFSVREREIEWAGTFGGKGGVARYLELRFRGGVELTIGPDWLGDLSDR